MLDEQLKTVQIFREHYGLETVEPFVIYGTGINAEAIINSCGDYPIAGIMDASKTEGNFCKKKILSEEEVLSMNIKLIVIVARPAVHNIIYKRLELWSQENNIHIKDIWGNDIAKKIEEKKCESSYFSISYEQILNQIKKYDIISFDVFDTLVTRKLYEPQDVFQLLDKEYADRYPFIFSHERMIAEQQLLKQGETDIYQIYHQMKQNNPCLSEKDCESLLEYEIQKECQVLIPRKKMVECLKYCINKGKRVFLISDMYLPGNILSNILAQFGIIQYEKIFVSCDYGVSKKDGLFRIMKKYIGANYTCLHIGDNEQRDGTAIKEKIDIFLIKSPLNMIEISTYAPLLAYIKNLESRIMIGLLISEVFNDPFILNYSEGKPSITWKKTFGYIFIAPLIVSFLIWMLKKLEKDNKSVLFFSARDGWLIQQIYHLLIQKFQMKNLPHDEYLLISRRAILSLDEENNYDKKKQYLRYLSEFNLENFEKIYFFDFMSRGTCQYHLEKLIHRQCHGLYFQKSNSGHLGKDQLKVESYYKEKTAQSSERYIFAICDFLECILTSFESSFLEFDKEGRIIYTKERRSKEQMVCIREIHQGIWEYSQQFAEIINYFPEKVPPVELSDTILSFISSSKSRIMIPELKKIILDDIDYGDKNTGQDALE